MDNDRWLSAGLRRHSFRVVEGRDSATAKISLDGIVTSWTRSAARLFGRSFDAAIGLNIATMLTDVEWRVTTGASDQAELSARLLGAPNSTAKSLAIGVDAVRDDAQTLIGLRLHFRELPRDRAKSNAHVTAQRVAEIAHDMNILLALAQCHAEFLSTTTLTPPQRHELELAQRATTRVGHLARRLLDNDSRNQPRRLLCDVNEVVQNMHLLFARTLGDGVELRARLSASVASIYGAPESLERIISNLIVNARDALVESGTITVTVEHERIGPDHSLYGKLRGGRYIKLSVADTGAGITEEHLPHVFEYGLTTKRADKSADLGLSIVRDAVNELSGDIQVETEFGKGSVFVIHLPDAHDPIHPNFAVGLRPEPALAPEFRSAVCGAFGRVRAAARTRPVVLVVDDDAALRDSLMRVLAELEVDALGARSAREALRVLEQRPVDVLVSEQFVDGVDATPLLEEVRHRFPDTARALLSAHHSPDLLAAAVNRARVSKILRKNMHPLTIREEIASLALEVVRKRETSFGPPTR
ncbi:MAG TPA: ATP-binding protein [Polyangiaceae bacterium]|nr:ATP-binding protein [Polyangiaceae bacterium]